MRPATSLIVCLSTVVTFSCGENGDVTEPIQNVSFSTEVQPIFTANCISLGCHIGPNPQLGMDLTVGQTIASIVGVESVQSALLRVAPGQSSSSYLYQKVSGGQITSGGSGDRMPPPPRLALDDNELEVIRVWIEEGALNN